MRNRVTSSGVTVNAIAGTHVVLLGLDLSDAKRAGCLGFAIQREDSKDNERLWLRGMKAFKLTDPGLGPGGNAPSNEQPFQTFQWADYAAVPGVDYRYAVTPMYGTPDKLKPGVEVVLEVKTEPELGSPHSVFFNRGSAASQEYARRFGARGPDEVGAPAFKWLSRGLFEAMVAFIGRAKDSTFGLRCAIYEFQWPAALAAFKQASADGADVKILYDAIPGTGPGVKNEAAITLAGIEAICTARTNGKIMHNKFIVLTKNGKPTAVWTGSTNMTENGIFGHCNVGHIVEDSQVASAYMDYWDELVGDPQPKDERIWVGENNSSPPQTAIPMIDPLIPVFSPRSGLDVLHWYADLAGRLPQQGPRGSLFMTFAFGMHADFQKVYERQDGVLRMALMEKEGNGAALAQGKIDIARIRRLPNVVVAIGHSIAMNSFDRWLKERDKVNASAGVKYVHNKFLLSDPLGPDPIVVTGSANFSEASTTANNENMLVIRGDQRTADIYLGEFMRVFSHYSFREAVAIAKEKGETEWKPQFLDPTDGWAGDYYRPGSQRCLKREYFAG